MIFEVSHSCWRYSGKSGRNKEALPIPRRSACLDERALQRFEGERSPPVSRIRGLWASEGNKSKTSIIWCEKYEKNACLRDLAMKPEM